MSPHVLWRLYSRASSGRRWYLRRVLQTAESRGSAVQHDGPQFAEFTQGKLALSLPLSSPDFSLNPLTAPREDMLHLQKQWMPVEGQSQRAVSPSSRLQVRLRLPQRPSRVRRSPYCPSPAPLTPPQSSVCGCSYAVTACPYGCGQKVDSKRLRMHQNCCEYRPVNDCPCGHTFRFNQRREHRQTCLAWHQQMVSSPPPPQDVCVCAQPTGDLPGCITPTSTQHGVRARALPAA